MTDQQLYLSIGVPTLLVLVGILINIGYFVTMNGRFPALEACIQGLDSRLDARINSLEAKFELLVGKVIELDNRLTRIEEKLSH